MTKEIIYTENYALIVDDSEIKEGDWYIDDTNIIRVAITSDSEYWNKRKNYKKIIFHLPLNGSKELEGVPLLPEMKSNKELPTHFEFEMYEQKFINGQKIKLINGKPTAVGTYKY